VGIVNSSRTIKLPVVSDANRNKGNNKIIGLEVQKPTQALKSVKGPVNTFDGQPKWARTLPSLIYFSWDIYRDPPLHKKNQISKLIFDTLLWV
jgi:hypothetical protein